MKIDFSAIDKIGDKTAENDFKDIDTPNGIDAEKKPLKNDFKGLSAQNDMLIINKNYEQYKKERNQYSEYCKTIAENKKQTSKIKVDILDYMDRGYSLSSILLKACKAISLCTNDTLFYEQAKEKLFDVYAKGLDDTKTKYLLANDIGRRLRLLQKAHFREPNNKNIEKALKAHIAEYERITGEKV